MEFPITWGTDIPVGAIITSASLLLYNYFTNAEGRTYWAYRLLRLDWSETGSSWAYYSSPSGWTSGGASSDGNDYTSADGASATVAGAGAWMSWNVLNQVKAAQTGSLQIAFLIKDETENTNAQTNFYSRNYVDNTTLRPKLVIEYTVPAVSRSFGLIIG